MCQYGKGQCTECGHRLKIRPCLNCRERDRLLETRG